MPMHDWNRVSAGTYHGFHTLWIAELTRVLNNDLLPSPYYAEPEQVAGETGPDVLTLEASSDDWELDSPVESGDTGSVATLADIKPNVTLTQTASEAEIYGRRRNRLAIRHSSGNTPIAYVELISSGNKSSRRAMERLLDKAVSVIDQGIHLTIVDPFPPGTFDEHGIHGEIWNQIDPSSAFVFPDGRHLTTVSYHAIRPSVAYVEPLGVSDALPQMPLFLSDQKYVNLPLESTYMAAFGAIPKHFRQQLTLSE